MDTQLLAQIGSHTFHLDGDVVVGKLRGDFTAKEAHELFELLRAVSKEYGTYFLMTDIAELGTIDPAARRAMTRESTIVGCRACAVLGATLVTRTLVTLILRAMALFQGPSGSPTRFLRGARQASAWFDRLRRGDSSRSNSSSGVFGSINPKSAATPSPSVK